MTDEQALPTTPTQDVANLLYGEPPKVEEPETPDTETQELSDPVVSDPEIQTSEEDGEGIDPTEEVVQDASAESPQDEPDGEVQEVEIQTVQQLAEHLETQPEWIETLEIEQKVNGEPIKVKIADALATHRKVTAADQYLADAKEKGKAQIEQAAHQQAELAASLTAVGELIKTIEGGIDSEVANTDMAALRRDDPAEYAARKEQIRERREYVANLKQKAADSFTKAQQDAQQQAERALAEALPREQEILLEKVPEWQDEDKASQEKTQVVEYLTSQGFSESDIKAASFRGNLLALSVKAMRYDNARAKSEVSKKKVLKIPKVLKPGAKKDEAKPTVRSDDPQTILYGG